MTVLARFDILGTPVQQGSKKGFMQGGRVQLVEDAGPRHKSWRATVAEAARTVADADPLAAEGREPTEEPTEEPET